MRLTRSSNSSYFFGESVAKRPLPRPVDDFGKFIQRLSADSLSGRIGTGVLRILFFQFRQFALKRIQRRLGNFLPVQNMIKIAMVIYNSQSFSIRFLPLSYLSLTLLFQSFKDSHFYRPFQLERRG